mgnify:CR=1 FL=1
MANYKGNQSSVYRALSSISRVSDRKEREAIGKGGSRLLKEIEKAQQAVQRISDAAREALENGYHGKEYDFSIREIQRKNANITAWLGQMKCTAGMLASVKRTDK